MPEQITCKVFPAHARYGPQAGKENEAFLDAGDAAARCSCARCCRTAQKTALLIFEFGAFGQRSFDGPGRVSGPARPVPGRAAAGFRYAVEIRNPEFLEKDYFACLRSHGVAHVYNAWSKMPELRHQMAIPDSATADFLVCRALLRRGRVYEEAVATFAPYTRDPGPESRRRANRCAC